MEAGKTTDLSGLSVLSLLFTTLLSGLFPSHYFSCFVSTKDRKPWPGRWDLTFTFLSFPPVLEQEFWVPTCAFGIENTAEYYDFTRVF